MSDDDYAEDGEPENIYEPEDTIEEDIDEESINNLIDNLLDNGWDDVEQYYVPKNLDAIVSYIKKYFPESLNKECTMTDININDPESMGNFSRMVEFVSKQLTADIDRKNNLLDYTSFLLKTNHNSVKNTARDTTFIDGLRNPDFSKKFTPNYNQGWQRQRETEYKQSGHSPFLPPTPAAFGKKSLKKQKTKMQKTKTRKTKTRKTKSIKKTL
jgi:hypothetical protein